ncbi:MAG: fumarylacetoacetate hydrolase family protein [Bergeyella sp.]|nr:fumarylacetoacetate hydrolase family protein [Bergeyella sp.]
MKIICIGRNYKEHAQELGNEIPESPVIFLKPETALLKGRDFYIPEFSKNIHYELEIVIKISKGGKYILKENASKHFEEISLGIDFTARDLQDHLKSKGLPWELSKGFDGAAGVGSFFSKENFNLKALNFSLELSEKTVQKGNTRDMIFSFEEIIAFVSQYFTLKTGDLLFTGTPKGVGKVSERDILKGYIEKEKIIDIKIH